MSHEPAGASARPAREVVRDVKLPAKTLQLLQPEQTAGELLALLVRHKRYRDAVLFAAPALDKPQAVWWGTLCLWERYRPRAPQEVSAVLQAIVAWLATPDDGHRRAVDNAGKLAGITTPAGCLASAVFFSGGSVSLPDQPHVDPKPHITAKNVAQAVSLAARLQGRDAETAYQARCLLLALQIARGELPWHTAEPVVAGAGA